jgi:hypothetical protein
MKNYNKFKKVNEDNTDLKNKLFNNKYLKELYNEIESSFYWCR